MPSSKVLKNYFRLKTQLQCSCRSKKLKSATEYQALLSDSQPIFLEMLYLQYINLL